MSEIVNRLSDGKHPVEFSSRPDKTLETLRRALDRGFVHVRFTDTRGGTDLGFAIDLVRSVTNTADCQNGTGTIKLAGALTLDYVPVRCIAVIDLPSLKGVGWLEHRSAES